MCLAKGLDWREFVNFFIFALDGVFTGLFFSPHARLDREEQFTLDHSHLLAQ